jgi:hypothetical protein
MMWTIEIHSDDVIMTVEIVMVIKEIKEVVDMSISTTTKVRPVSSPN